MESLLSKISAYHLISYGLTGLLLTSCYVVLHGLSTSFGPAIAFGGVYLVGILVSRVGSVVMEWPLKKIGFIKYAIYSDYVEAESVDSKVSGLAEQSAFYRTLSCGFSLLAIFSGFDRREPVIIDFAGWIETSAYSAMAILFLFAYRKQCKFVFDRVATQIALKRQT